MSEQSAFGHLSQYLTGFSGVELVPSTQVEMEINASRVRDDLDTDFVAKLSTSSAILSTLTSGHRGLSYVLFPESVERPTDLTDYANLGMQLAIGVIWDEETPEAYRILALKVLLGYYNQVSITPNYESQRISDETLIATIATLGFSVGKGVTEVAQAKARFEDAKVLLGNVLRTERRVIQAEQKAETITTALSARRGGQKYYVAMLDAVEKVLGLKSFPTIRNPGSFADEITKHTIASPDNYRLGERTEEERVRQLDIGCRSTLARLFPGEDLNILMRSLPEELKLRLGEVSLRVMDLTMQERMTSGRRMAFIHRQAFLELNEARETLARVEDEVRVWKAAL